MQSSSHLPNPEQVLTSFINDRSKLCTAERLPLDILKQILPYPHHQIENLKNEFESVRIFKNDGNTFYRCVGISFLEYLCRSTTDISKLTEFLNYYMTNSGYMVCSQIARDTRNIFIGLLEHLFRFKSSSDQRILRAIDHSLQVLQNDAALVNEMRSLTANYIQANSRNQFFESYSRDLNAEILNILTVNKECGELAYYSLSSALGVYIKIVTLQPPSMNLYGMISHRAPVIVILKTDKYDILYSYAMNRLDCYDSNRMDYIRYALTSEDERACDEKLYWVNRIYLDCGHGYYKEDILKNIRETIILRGQNQDLAVKCLECLRSTPIDHLYTIQAEIKDILNSIPARLPNIYPNPPSSAPPNYNYPYLQPYTTSQPQSYTIPQLQTHTTPQLQTHTTPQLQTHTTLQPQSYTTLQLQAQTIPQPQVYSALQPQAHNIPKLQAHNIPKLQAQTIPQLQAQTITQPQVYTLQPQSYTTPQLQNHNIPQLQIHKIPQLQTSIDLTQTYRPAASTTSQPYTYTNDTLHYQHLDSLLNCRISTSSPVRIELEALKRSFASEEIKSRLDFIMHKYDSFRRSRGDGNCYYRAVGIGYLEHLCRITTPLSEFITFYNKLCSDSGHYQIREINSSSKLYLMRKLQELLHHKTTTPFILPHLEELILDTSFDIAVIHEMRCLAANYLEMNKHKPPLSDFLFEGIDEDMKKILTVGTEAEGITFSVMASVLEVFIQHVSVFDSSEDDPFEPPGIEKGPMIYVMFKKGHYDIMYSKDMTEVDGYNLKELRYEEIEVDGNRYLERLYYDKKCKDRYKISYYAKASGNMKGGSQGMVRQSSYNIQSVESIAQTLPANPRPDSISMMNNTASNSSRSESLSSSNIARFSSNQPQDSERYYSNAPVSKTTSSNSSINISSSSQKSLEIEISDSQVPGLGNSITFSCGDSTIISKALFIFFKKFLETTLTEYITFIRCDTCKFYIRVSKNKEVIPLLDSISSLINRMFEWNLQEERQQSITQTSMFEAIEVSESENMTHTVMETEPMTVIAEIATVEEATNITTPSYDLVNIEAKERKAGEVNQMTIDLRNTASIFSNPAPEERKRNDIIMYTNTFAKLEKQSVPCLDEGLSAKESRDSTTETIEDKYPTKRKSDYDNINAKKMKHWIQNQDTSLGFMEILQPNNQEPSSTCIKEEYKESAMEIDYNPSQEADKSLSISADMMSDNQYSGTSLPSIRYSDFKLEDSLSSVHGPIIKLEYEDTTITRPKNPQFSSEDLRIKEEDLNLPTSDLDEPRSGYIDYYGDTHPEITEEEKQNREEQEICDLENDLRRFSVDRSLNESISEAHKEYDIPEDEKENPREPLISSIKHASGNMMERKPELSRKESDGETGEDIRPLIDTFSKPTTLSVAKKAKYPEDLAPPCNSTPKFGNKSSADIPYMNQDRITQFKEETKRETRHKKLANIEENIKEETKRETRHKKLANIEENKTPVKKSKRTAKDERIKLLDYRRYPIEHLKTTAKDNGFLKKLKSFHSFMKFECGDDIYYVIGVSYLEYLCRPSTSYDMITKYTHRVNNRRNREYCNLLNSLTKSKKEKGSSLSLLYYYLSSEELKEILISVMRNHASKYLESNYKKQSIKQHITNGMDSSRQKILNSKEKVTACGLECLAHSLEVLITIYNSDRDRIKVYGDQKCSDLSINIFMSNNYTIYYTLYTEEVHIADDYDSIFTNESQEPYKIDMVPETQLACGHVIDESMLEYIEMFVSSIPEEFEIEGIMCFECLSWSRLKNLRELKEYISNLKVPSLSDKREDRIKCLNCQKKFKLQMSQDFKRFCNKCTYSIISKGYMKAKSSQRAEDFYNYIMAKLENENIECEDCKEPMTIYESLKQDQEVLFICHDCRSKRKCVSCNKIVTNNQIPQKAYCECMICTTCCDKIINEFYGICPNCNASYLEICSRCSKEGALHLDCGHFYCRECIVEFSKSRMGVYCPECEKPLMKVLDEYFLRVIEEKEETVANNICRMCLKDKRSSNLIESDCGVRYCKKCLSDYMNFKLNNRFGNAKGIECPFCSSFLQPEFINEKLKEDLSNKYRDFIRSFTKTINCPGCRQSIRGEYRITQCNRCTLLLCTNCLLAPHDEPCNPEDINKIEKQHTRSSCTTYDCPACGVSNKYILKTSKPFICSNLECSEVFCQDCLCYMSQVIAHGNAFHTPRCKHYDPEDIRKGYMPYKCAICKRIKKECSQPL